MYNLRVHSRGGQIFGIWLSVSVGQRLKDLKSSVSTAHLGVLDCEVNLVSLIWSSMGSESLG